ncbi:MAG: FliM/FliN family flagellar motor switch protein [Planctomycetota bacterium]|nr:MAG: FliM/FliN family flagellar motor switch protein [Planctomycetota bacterium]MCQ3920052.1 hypothetical protein [Planctomycetota bacterium]
MTGPRFSAGLSEEAPRNRRDRATPAAWFFVVLNRPAIAADTGSFVRRGAARRAGTIMMVLTQEKARATTSDPEPPGNRAEIAAPHPVSAFPAAPDAASKACTPASEPAHGLLRLTVPLRVRVAERQMRVRAILDLTPGSIVEFDTPASSELDLLANNRLIARGVAVKVGENFGLQVTQVASPSRTAS